MARKRKSEVAVRPSRTSLPKLPFTMGDRSAFIRKAWVAVEKMGKDHLCALYFEFSYGWVNACAVGTDEIDFDHMGKKPFYVDGDHTGFGPEGLAKTHLQWLYYQALKGGATPDAIRLLKKVTTVTAKEEREMAEKAASAKNKVAKKAKAAPAAAADEAAAPVGGGGKAAKAGKAKGGNADALAKARAARAENAGPDNRKIKVLNKENPYREGSNRASSFNALKGAKTVEDYKSAGGKTKYLSRWAEEERISLG